MLDEHKGEKTEEVAHILSMKALLYSQVLENEGKAVELYMQLQKEFPETDYAKRADAVIATLEKEPLP